MDVDAVSFPHHLLGMLIAISEADFVSFDLELSGIPSRMPNKSGVFGRGRTRTLEDRYLEAKAGAETHQVLQVGFTCARFDYLEEKYILRPYNVNISPIVSERLDIEREFSLQTGAITFLLENGFRFDKPFSRGVQYLSRDEAAEAKERAYNRIDKKNIFDDLQLKETDVESLDFVRRVREAITEWKTTGNQSLVITTHTGLDLELQPGYPVITRFEKRLAHQLVRAEFPDLVTLSKQDCIRVIHFDEVREQENKEYQKKKVKEQIEKQTGFRWVVEALARGNIPDFAPAFFCRNPTGDVISGNLSNIKDRFDRAKMRLRDRQPVLVGHNMFTDLVYFFRAFIGDLPDTLDGFCRAVHTVFPKIVDTKYMATHDGGDLHASPTLADIAQQLRLQALPKIFTHQDHPKYNDVQPLHEAGYDSLLTATIMLRLSTKIYADSLPPVETTFASISSMDTAQGSIAPSSPEIRSSLATPDTSEVDSVMAEDTLNGSARTTGQTKKKKAEKRAKERMEKQEQSRFASNNSFAFLQREDSDDSESKTPDEPDTPWTEEAFEPDSSEIVPIKKHKRHPMEIVPDFDVSEFWSKFGNRLRIFGTEETVLHIADWPLSENRSP